MFVQWKKYLKEKVTWLKNKLLKVIDVLSYKDVFVVIQSNFKLVFERIYKVLFLYKIPKSLILYSLTDTTISGAGSFPKECRKHTCSSNEITRPLND